MPEHRTTAPWREVELELRAAQDHADPYTGVDVDVEFTHPDGTVLTRPGFFDGDGRWGVRFAPPRAGTWTWRSTPTVPDAGLTGGGTVEVSPPTDDATATAFERHGFWRMSDAGRHLVHADGHPAVLVADTAWALPWRATHGQVEEYARDRAAKGFNAVLLMSVQPDTRAQGPEDRTLDEGFARGFDDLPDGRLTRLRTDYFQHLDTTSSILLAHGLVPVWQPVFQGFGWKGLDVAGVLVPPAEYARYCRYLVARYGGRPAVWLVGADGTGEEPQVEAGGREVHAVDALAQPTGIHYRPHALARAHQDAPWLDFQWCQTGHGGEHVPERVADMHRNLPEKALANGEPTYENTAVTGLAGGWWQGHEAWSNLCAGAAMGVVHGAGSLWQWKLHPDEVGQSPRFSAPGAGWREALSFPGSTVVGLVGRILDGLPMTDARPDWQVVNRPHALLVPDEFLLVYAPDGGDVRFYCEDPVPAPFRIVDPRTGEVLREGVRRPGEVLPDPGGAPRVYLCCREFPAPLRPLGATP